ncbi:hypothetical protein ANTPLA_LOCUS1753, partial [Anthophora plagiata]
MDSCRELKALYFKTNGISMEGQVEDPQILHSSPLELKGSPEGFFCSGILAERKYYEMERSGHHRNQGKDFNVRKNEEMQLFKQISIIYCKIIVQNVFYKSIEYTSNTLQ